MHFYYKHLHDFELNTLYIRITVREEKGKEDVHSKPE